MTHARLAVLPLLATTLFAQARPCASLNDATNSATPAITAFAFAGPTSLGWQFTPSTPVVAQALRIFTGNTMSANSMKLEIWSNDTATNLPLAQIGRASCR